MSLSSITRSSQPVHSFAADRPSPAPEDTAVALPSSSFNRNFRRLSQSHRLSLGRHDRTDTESNIHCRPASICALASPGTRLDQLVERNQNPASTSPEFDSGFPFQTRSSIIMGPTASIRTSSGSRSRATSNHSRFDCDASISGDEPRADDASAGNDKKRFGKPRWMSQVKSWLATSEPSAQAMKEQKKSTYKKLGIDFKDPQAAAKMHCPLGKVPANAITSTSGPTPEKAFKEKVQATQRRQSCVRHSRGSQSMSSGFSSVPSVKGVVNPIAPWDS